MRFENGVAKEKVCYSCGFEQESTGLLHLRYWSTATSLLKTKGPSIKYVRKNLPILDPPPPPSCTQCVRIGLDPPPPASPPVRTYAIFMDI